LQERRVERLGGTRSIPLDVRIIAATHRDLDEMVKTGEFREDLYYRLNVIPLTIPPLRERLEDVPILVQFYLDYYSTVTDRSVSGISQETIDILANYPWPGNVRELGNVVEYCVTMVAGGEITADILPQRIKTVLNPESQNTSLNLKMMEREAIMKALTLVDSEGHKDDAAKLLGISRATLYRKIKDYQIGVTKTFS
jgi:transcriptional regulator with PAS, ATPase and Fis domain